ncbi:MAG: sigma 54-interacting transcriptional regulator [Deltaproteobacteria bacterium]|nr:sigma 54-interacting transcriptional regulator [Deltaproteobacteria bacterium]
MVGKTIQIGKYQVDGVHHICRAILDSIDEGVFTVNREKEILFFNAPAELITGFSAKEAIGQYCFDILRCNRCNTICPVDQTFQTGKQIVNEAAVITNVKGIRIPININTSPLLDERGKVMGTVFTFRDLTEIEILRKELNGRYTYQDIISKSPRMRSLFDTLPIIAESDSTVLIQGASGTGKELVARAIHELSKRRNGPLVDINCGGIPDTLLESELFGYKKGAFTDAKTDKPGRIALAQGGTLFLDEVGEMSPALQVKLLRFLEQKRYIPLGGTEPLSADVRIISATHRDLHREMQRGDFRDDLFYRINVIRIDLPPLCDRKEDIPLLARHFVQRINARLGKSILGISDEVLRVLMNYPFPGNIRELENIIEHAAVLCRGSIIEIKDLPKELTEKVETTVGEKHLFSPLNRVEAEVIRKTLEEHGGDRIQTANALGISRSTLWRRIKRYGLDQDKSFR